MLRRVRQRVGLALALGALAARGRVLNIATDCGAAGDNATVNTRALNACVARAAAGDTLLVPRGVFLTGTVALRAGQTLRFADGGWLQGSANVSDYGADWDYWHVVNAVGAADVTIVADSRGGGGIAGPMWKMIDRFDPAQQMWRPAEWTGAYGCTDECRPKNLALVDAPRARLLNFALRDSADWTLLLRRTSDALVDGLVIRGSQQWPNGDGIDIESGENITLQNLDIATGDDAIAMRSGNCNAMRTPWARPLPPLRGVRVRNCTLSSSSAAIKVENLFQRDHGNVSDIDVDGVTIVNSNRGVGVWQRVAGPSGGRMSNLTFRNLAIETRFMFGTAWWGSGEALVVTTVPEDAAQAATGLPGINGVLFENVVARAEGGSLFSSRGQAATSPRALDGLVLRNVSLTIVGAGGNVTHAQLDFRPVDAGGGAPNTVPAPVTALTFESAVGATVEGGSRVTFEGPAQPYWAGAGGRGACVTGAAEVDASFACTLAA
jgi:polygalacturonase